MLKEKVVEHFGSKEAVQERLSISRQAFEKWGEVIPESQATKLDCITRRKRNRLIYEEEVYK